MSPKNNTKVIIGGDVYTLAGDESEEYIQRVALYINKKLDDLKASDNGQLLNTRLMSILLAINIADDYFKTNEQIQDAEQVLIDKDEKITALENDIIRLQSELERSNSKVKELQNDVHTYKSELDEYIETFDVDEE